MTFKKNSTPKKIFFRLPFLGVLSLQIHNELKSFFHKHTDDKASVCIADTLSKVEEKSRFKNRLPHY